MAQNLINNHEFTESDPGNNKIFIFDRNMTFDNPWSYTTFWNMENNYEILPNMATPDIFRSTQNTQFNTGKNARIFPCSGPGGNVQGIQAPWDYCSSTCLNPPEQLTKSFAGIGYAFHYSTDNKLIFPNTYDKKHQWSEYLVQKLSAPLSTNKVYRLTYKISRSDFGDWTEKDSNIALTYFGALFTQNKITRIQQPEYTYPIEEAYWNGITVLNKVPLDKYGNYTSPNNCHWMQVEGYFKPCQAFNYIYIGHFNPDIRKEIGTAFECGKNLTYATYYFISDVHLEEYTQSPVGSCNCNNDLNYEVKTEPQVLNNAAGTCDPNQCCTKIIIKKNGTWDCNFNFVKLVIEFIDSKYDKISELVQMNASMMQEFNAGNDVDIYDLCLKKLPGITEFRVRTQFFNSIDVPPVNEPLPGVWYREKLTENLILPCECPCSEVSIIDKTRFKFEPDGEDALHRCCYKLSIDNRNSNCDLLIYGITGNISVLRNSTYIDLPSIERNNFTFGLIDNNRWSMRDPFWSDVPLPNFKWNYLVPTHYLAGIKTDIARICIPNDGDLYKFNFSVITNPIDNSGCKAPDFFAQCYPSSPNPETCCDNLSVNVREAENDCCYYFYIKVLDDNCTPDHFNIFDGASNLLDKNNQVSYNVAFSSGSDDDLGKKFGPYCISRGGLHHFRMDIYYKDGTVCNKTFEDMNCPVEDCCNSISVIPNSPITDDYHCFFNFNISSSGSSNCIPTTVNIKDMDNDISFGDFSPAVGTNIGTNSIYFNKGSGIHHLQFNFTLPNNIHCTKDIILNCDDDCCQKLHVTVSQDPVVYDDGNECCFQMNITVDDNSCNLGVIQIFDDYGHLIFETTGTIPVGSSIHKFCVSRESFNGLSTLNLHINFISQNGYLICPKEGIINACNAFPTPCTPDGSSDSWIADPDEHTVTFFCPSNPGPASPCQVSFHFSYRNITINGVKHRDVQITSYKFNDGCYCDDEKLKQMLEFIWGYNPVMNYFEIHDSPNWQIGDTLCYEDFRVISSDCWEANWIYPFTYTKRCSSDVCCWAQFRVCYKKIDQNIIVFDSETRLLGSDETSIQCPYPCDSRNCHLIKNNQNMQRAIEDSDAKFSINSPCKVELISNKDLSRQYINVECFEKGPLQAIVYDLLGNMIYSDETNKRDFLVKIPMTDKLTPGTYFIKIIINGNVIYQSKFIYLK